MPRPGLRRHASVMTRLTPGRMVLSRGSATVIPTSGLPGIAGSFAVGVRVGKYRLEQQWPGGMAVVFLARDERLDRLVAVKIMARCLPRRGLPAAVHPGVAGGGGGRRPAHHPGVRGRGGGGVLYIAMRYVAGGDVRSLREPGGSVSAARAAAIISPVASALDAAHAAGLVHRDVKPANMLVDVRAGPAGSRVPGGLRAEQGHIGGGRADRTGRVPGNVRTMPRRSRSRAGG